jgi:ADP-ribosyl-[dinitrogen reductase] hydrolase
MKPNLQHRFRGCLQGLACGDAVGASIEYKQHGTFKPLTDMVGGGRSVEGWRN